MSGQEFIACVNPSIGAKLLSYGLGHLSETERNEFEEHLLVCRACQSELKAAGNTLKAMAGSAGELSQRLLSAPPPASPPAFTKSAWLWRAMAAAACLIGLIYWAAQPGTETIPSSSLQVPVDSQETLAAIHDTLEFAKADSTHADSDGQVKQYGTLATKVPLAYIAISPRGQAMSNRKMFEQAMQSYQNMDFRTAADHLRKLDSSDSSDTELLLYWGISAYLSGNAAEAIRVFDRAEAAKPRTTRLAQVRWYRANAKLVSGDVVGAKRDLSLVAKSGTPLSGDAGRLRTKLP